MHKICSQIHDSVQLQQTALSTCNDDLAQLKAKHSSAVGYTHDICSELQKGLLEHANEREGLHASLRQQQNAITLLQKKDVVAQELLDKMLTMLDHHDTVVATGKPISEDHMSLLDSMCVAFEKTKQRMQTFEQTQEDMKRAIADFKAGDGARGARAGGMAREADSLAGENREGTCGSAGCTRSAAAAEADGCRGRRL
jgi:hypothetical protein